jgi:hypothetical protein
MFFAELTGEGKIIWSRRHPLCTHLFDGIDGEGERKMKILYLGKMVEGSQAKRIQSGALVWGSLLMSLLILSACYPAYYQTVPQRPVEPAQSSQAYSTQVYFYPTQGQSTEQQSRDHYECYNWAIKQTGFDPGQSAIPTEQRVSVVPMPPLGHDTVAYTIAGGVLGALIGGPRHAGGGAIIGAASGAIAGSASDATRAEAARQQEQAYQNRSVDPQLVNKAAGFRRAMSACLEGRGYSVR